MTYYVKPIESYYFNIDHLEIYAFFRDESIFSGVDFDNSHFGMLGDFVFTKHEVKRYDYKVEFSKDGIPMFAFYSGKRTGVVTSKDYVCFYSSFFFTHSEKEFLDIFNTYFHFGSANRLSKYYRGKGNLRRFDICLDLLLPIKTVDSYFKDEAQKGATFRGEGGRLETQYIGEYKKSKNKRSLIRIYDKKADIIRKKKDKLMQEYLLQEHVTRIELEVRRELTQNYSLEEIFVKENLWGIMKNYFRKHTHIFDKLEVEKISLYKHPLKVDFGLIQANSRKRKQVKMFIGHARGLLERDICPLYALIAQGLIHKDTRKILTEIGELNQGIEYILGSHEGWKKIVDNVQSKYAPD